MNYSLQMTKHVKHFIIGIITGILNGLFGSGGGTVVVPALVLLLGANEQKAHATAISIIFPLTLVSAFFYISNNSMDWQIILKVMLGGILGGYIGAKLLNICPDNWLRKIFSIFIIIAAVRLLMN